MDQINVSYDEWKAFVAANPAAKPYQVMASGKYRLSAKLGDLVVTATAEGDNIADFEAGLKASCNQKPVAEVMTQMEIQRTLSSVCAFAETDAQGVAKVAIPIPAGGRYLAYGDAEFETRHFGDMISKIEVHDLDREIALMLAQAQDPNATEPLSDAAVIALGAQVPGGPFPDYPLLGAYQERGLPNPLPSNTVGDVKPGMTMTFNFGVTEVQPIGGYGFAALGYLVLEAQKAAGHTTAGQKCQFSVDWAV